jgi:hypothetical protein
VIPTPDGVRYLHLGQGDPVPKPYHLRWLIPRLCRADFRRWRAASLVSWALATIMVGLMAPSWQTGIAAAALFAVLPGIVYNLRHPILVDLPALALAVTAAVLARHGYLETAVAVSLLAGACKEPAPLFAAIYAWNPILLVGLLGPAVTSLVKKAGSIDRDPLRFWQVSGRGYDPEFAWILRHPFRAGWKYHRPLWLDGTVMVAPWGGALVAVTNPSWQLLAALTVGYAQLLVATDSVRLYQWAAPVVCVAAATAVPVTWLVLLVVLSCWNPLAGDGV